MTGAPAPPAAAAPEASAPADAALPAEARDIIDSAIRILEAAAAQRQAANKVREAFEQQRLALVQAVSAQKAAALMQTVNGLQFLQGTMAKPAAAPASPPPPPAPPAEVPPKPAGPTREEVEEQIGAIVRRLVAEEVARQLAKPRRGPLAPGAKSKPLRRTAPRGN
ncbi:MAG: hypothetical protein H7841_13635 [Magnetospirillum sp. WYHS-4]